MTEEDKQMEIIRRRIEENKEHAKRMGCEECWDWNPEICGYNCPDYHR